jgi:hypothetical protein
MKIELDDVVSEYEKRGDQEILNEIAGLTESERDRWASDCVACDVCGDVLLHDDEAYTDGNTGEHLCDDHSIFDESEGFYVKSV